MSQNRTERVRRCLESRYPYKIDLRLVRKVGSVLLKPRPREFANKREYRLARDAHTRFIATLVALPYNLWRDDNGNTQN